jgi:hypothetical protein
MSDSKLIELVSFIFIAGLVKIVYDLKNDDACKDIDSSIAGKIYYHGIFALIVSSMNLVNIDIYKYLFR